MKEMLLTLFAAVITAAVPVITTYVVSYIKKEKEAAQAETDDIKKKGYIEEVAIAISDAVLATSQTYVDALKQNGKFTLEAQAEAARKALNACIASLAPDTAKFIEATYGDLKEYLSNKIEAEVRKQKMEAPATLALPVMESTTDTTAVAASTAAATAASVIQTAISQIDAEAKALATE